MKKIFTIVLSSLFFIASGQTNLQNASKTLPTITRPSPTVSQLMKVEEAQLDNYTGQPNITIPLFSNTVKNLNVDVSLSYNSSGIRVNEQSGWVGKGWSLTAGGVISRSVVDIPDEINTNKFKGVNYNLYHDYFNSGTTIEARQQYVYDSQWGTNADVDSKNDVYQFNFFGKTGRFVFTMSGGILKPVMIEEENNFKIEVTYNNTTNSIFYPVEIASFVITDDSGYKYYFTEIERTEKKDFTFSYSQPGCNGPIAPSPSINIGKFISAWHLSKVEDENGVKLIDITYHNVLEKPKTPVSRIYYYPEDTHTVYNGLIQECNTYIKCALKPQMVENIPLRAIETKKINRITFQDKSYIRFFISASHPEYVDGAGASLTSIGVYNNQGTAALKTFNFIYSAGGGTMFLEYMKNNNSEVNKYKFEYNKKGEYPDFDTMDKDIFGYYNLPPAKESVFIGVLNKITYPTKGVRDFTWEPNTYSYLGNRLLTFKEIFNNPDNYTLSNAGIYDHYINQSNQTTNESYVFFSPYDQEVDLFYSTTTSSYFDPQTTMPNSVKIMPILPDANQTLDPLRQNLSYSIGINESKKTTVNLKPGYYKMSFLSLNALISGGEIAGDAYFKLKTAKGHLNWFLYGGGIRIKTIKDVENTADQIVKGYKYDLENPGITPVLPAFTGNPHLSNSFTFSSGSVDGLDNLVREYNVSIAPIYNVGGTEGHVMDYSVYEKQNELDAQLTRGSYVGYKNVFEYFYPNTGSLAYKSKTKFTYDSAIDSPSLVDDTYPYFPTISNTYKQSNVRKIEYFDTANTAVVTEDFKYNYDLQEIKETVKKNFYFMVDENSLASDCQKIRMLYTSYQNLAVFPFITAAQYDTNCNGINGTVAQYFSNLDKSDCIISLTTIDEDKQLYDYSYRVQLIEHSKKEYFGANTIESKDTFTYSTLNNNLLTKTSLLATGESTTAKYYYPPDLGMSAEPYRNVLVAKNMIATPLKTETFKNAEMVSVHKIEYGDVLLSDALQAEQFTTLALPEETKVYLKHIHTGKGSLLERKITFEKYDSKGNITQYTQENGVPVSCIWGHDGAHPLAKIENMAYSSIPSLLITDVVDASNTIPYSEENLLAKLTALRTDDALANAMVSAFTYKPLVGISKTIDPKGYKVNYFYDTYCRLKNVTDHEGKFVTQHFYNYRP